MSEVNGTNGQDDPPGGGTVSDTTDETPAAPPPDPETLLAEAKAEAQKMRENWMRSAADFDNFRKRSRKEVDDARKAGKEDLLKDLLPVFDNLERAVTSAHRATEVKPVMDGLNMVLRQFVDTLSRAQITRVAGKGTAFDPSVHEAIQQVESDEPPGTVISEVQPGYMNGDRLVRAAMVVVARARPEPPPDPAPADPPAEDPPADTAVADAADPAVADAADAAKAAVAADAKAEVESSGGEAEKT